MILSFFIGLFIFVKTSCITFDHTPPSEVYVKDTDLTLSCEAFDDPIPLIKWFYNGKEVVRGSYGGGLSHEKKYKKNHSIKFGAIVSKIRLREIIDPDSVFQQENTLSCVAYTDTKKKVSNTTIIINNRINLFNNNDPMIYMWSSNRIHKEHDDIQLVCRHTCTINECDVEIEWRKNGEPITDEKRFSILKNGDLLIKRLSFDDRGIYYCKVSNEYGSDERDIFVYPTFSDLDQKK
uniref:Ig-like domain-containing protein n=1 Tax=viral metagenome TaxID=1070528 RepID=A0A6C0JPS4_9ZZZZ